MLQTERRPGPLSLSSFQQPRPPPPMPPHPGQVVSIPCSCERDNLPFPHVLCAGLSDARGKQLRDRYPSHRQHKVDAPREIAHKRVDCIHGQAWVLSTGAKSAGGSAGGPEVQGSARPPVPGNLCPRSSPVLPQLRNKSALTSPAATNKKARFAPPPEISRMVPHFHRSDQIHHRPAITSTTWGNGIRLTNHLQRGYPLLYNTQCNSKDFGPLVNSCSSEIFLVSCTASQRIQILLADPQKGLASASPFPSARFRACSFGCGVSDSAFGRVFRCRQRSRSGQVVQRAGSSAGAQQCDCLEPPTRHTGSSPRASGSGSPRLSGTCSTRPVELGLNRGQLRAPTQGLSLAIQRQSGASGHFHRPPAATWVLTEGPCLTPGLYWPMEPVLTEITLWYSIVQIASCLGPK
jgi:hypothetical protein